MKFLYTPTSIVRLTPHQAHSPAPLIGVIRVPTCALTPPLEVPMVTYMSIKRTLTCQSDNLVYAITCQSCNLIYVGATSRSLAVHFSKHLADIHHNRSKPLAQHFNFAGHTIADIKVKGLWLLHDDSFQ